MTVALPCLALYQDDIQVFLGPSQPLGQNTAVALVHKQQNTGRFAAGQISQQVIDSVSLFEISLEYERDNCRRDRD